MRNYNKLIAGVFCAIALMFATSTFAATVEKGYGIFQAVQPVQAEVQPESLFNSDELGLSLSTGYVVDRSAPFQGDYTFNLTAGAFYFPTRYLGLEANVPFYQTDGVSVDEVQAGVLLRLPLGSSTPLFRNVAPYAGVGGVYNWEATDKWAYVAKAGVEVRLNSKWGVFAEGQYRNDDFTWENGATSVQGGLKFVF